jgi:hypothetical protein
MIEIGKALPNLTAPALTTAAAEILVSKALSFSGATMPGATMRVFRKSGYRVLRPEYAQVKSKKHFLRKCSGINPL